jgi:hypothetical protein
MKYIFIWLDDNWSLLFVITAIIATIYGLYALVNNVQQGEKHCAKICNQNLVFHCNPAENFVVCGNKEVHPFY